MYSLVALLIFVILLLFRIAVVVHGQARASTLSGRKLKGLLAGEAKAEPVKLLVLLGSGGHTAEMLRLLEQLKSSEHANKYAPVQYIVTAGDAMSEGKAGRFEGLSERESICARIHRVPRARRVKQPWTSTPFSTMWSLIASIRILWTVPFDAFLCNGPGTSVPLAMLIFLPKILGFSTPPIIYVESFARVKTLSLSGRLLYPIVDLFLVQWADLAKAWPKAQYHGILVA